MSIKDKIESAKTSDWPAEGLTKAEIKEAIRVGRGASRKWAFDGTVLSDATD